MIPLLTLKPSGSRDRAGIVVPTAGGALRVVGGEWLVEEGTVNLFKNPSAESTTSLYASVFNGVAEKSELRALYGASSMRVTGSAADAFALPHIDGTINPATYTFSSAVWVPSGPAWATQPPALWLYYNNGGATQNRNVSTNPALTDQWQRIAVSQSIAAGNTLFEPRLYQAKYAGNSGSDKAVSFDAFQLEVKDHATTFCPQYDTSGILLTGYTWSGAPHASSSTRAAASLAAPLPSSWQSAYIRYHEGDGTVHNVVLTDEGAIGTYGLLTVASNTVTITSNRALYLGAALFYDRALTTQEQARLDATPTALLGWGTLQQRQSGILRVDKPGLQLPGILTIGA